jgi:hypothetical protein
MIKPLIHYELEIANWEQEQLRRRAALWHLAQHRDSTGQQPLRQYWLRTGLSAAARVFRFTWPRTVTHRWRHPSNQEPPRVHPAAP